LLQFVFVVFGIAMQILHVCNNYVNKILEKKEKKKSWPYFKVSNQWNKIWYFTYNINIFNLYGVPVVL